MKSPDFFRLDAVQGSNENRANRIQTYGERDSQAADAVMRQEASGLAAWLASRMADGGVW